MGFKVLLNALSILFHNLPEYTTVNDFNPIMLGIFCLC